MKRINFVKTRSEAYKKIEAFNATIERPENQPKGLVGERINNEKEVVQLITAIANQYQNIRKGVIKITRTYLANAINRSTPVVDRILAKLEAAGILRKKGIGVNRFRGSVQAIGCLEIQILVEDLFVFCEKYKEVIKLFLDADQTELTKETMDYMKFIMVKNDKVDFQIKTPF